MSYILWAMNYYPVFALWFLIAKNIDWGIRYTFGPDGVGVFKDAIYVSSVPIIGIYIDASDLNQYLALCFPMLVGTTIRFGTLLKQKKLNMSIAVQHFMAAIPLCIVAYWAYMEVKSDWNLQLLISAVSYFSMYIVSVTDENGPAIARISLYKLTGWWHDFLKPKDNDNL